MMHEDDFLDQDYEDRYLDMLDDVDNVTGLAGSDYEFDSDLENPWDMDA